MGVDRPTSRPGGSPPHAGSRSSLAFASPAPQILAASSRQQCRLAATGYMQAALDLHEREKQQRVATKRSEMAKAQFFLLQRSRPRCSSRVSNRQSTRDPMLVKAKDAERVRWVRPLADLLAESPTPMGEALRSGPGDTSLPGAGRRVPTLRCQFGQLGDSTFPTTLADPLGFGRGCQDCPSEGIF